MAAIRLWAVSGIPVIIVEKAERQMLIRHRGLDLLLPMVDFSKRKFHAASHHVCEILWDIADLLDTQQFDRIVFSICQHDLCRAQLDTAEMRPFVRILAIDPSCARAPVITSWALDCVLSLLQIRACR